MRNFKKPDLVLLGTVLFLLILGIVILSSVSASYAQKKFDNSFYFLTHQIFAGLIPGLILAFYFFMTSLESLKKRAPIFLLMSLIMMAMVFLPKIGMSFGGSRSWLNLGFASFQPSELLKITFILYLASWLASRTSSEKLNNKPNKLKEDNFSQTFFAFLMALGTISLLLIFQPDIGTLGIIVLIAVLMYFLAKTPFRHVLFLASGGTALLFLLIKTSAYRINRFLVMLNPESDPMGIGYQLNQALIAVGSGGILGPGLGMSVQKFGFLPESISDSIFAIFAEETGFVGCFILISLFIMFLWSGFKIARNSRDKFSELAALGITSWIFLQAIINIGAIIGIFPLTGVPMPFVSYGGSALISELIGIGVLLNISKQKS